LGLGRPKTFAILCPSPVFAHSPRASVFTMQASETPDRTATSHLDKLSCSLRVLGESGFVFIHSHCFIRGTIFVFVRSQPPSFSGRHFSSQFIARYMFELILYYKKNHRVRLWSKSITKLTF
jgi:hypothetical protein